MADRASKGPRPRADLAAEESERPTAIASLPVARRAVEDVTEPPTSPTAPHPRRFRLVPVDGEAHAHECLGGACVVGVHPSNDLVLADATVSRFHCELLADEVKVRVRDLGSTNGTLVDGVRVRDAVLKTGSVLSLGSARLRFECEDRSIAQHVSASPRFGRLVGTSPVMRAVFHHLEAAARSDQAVLVEGEPGTGKTATALSIHQLGSRVDRPIEIIDCTLSEAQVSLALLGDGGQTGALDALFGGTLVLEEVSALPLELQTRLSRLLEDREHRDVRVLATSTVDLRVEVNVGRFRPDLYPRVAATRVVVPPLDDRLGDIPVLVKELVVSLGVTPALHPQLLAPAFLTRLMSLAWPGNVRQLKEHLERALAFALAQLDSTTEPQAGMSAHRAAALCHLPLAEARRLAVEAFERQYLSELLHRFGGRLALAALDAEVDRTTLAALLRRYGLPAK